MTDTPNPPFSLKDALGVSIDTIQVLDIGAMIEGEVRYGRLLDEGLAEITGIEPNSEERARLEKEGPKNCTWLPYFLGNGDDATFHITLYRGCSSLFEPDPAVIDQFQTIGATQPGGNFHVVGTEPVKTTRLDDVEELPAVDYMKIDVQGAELEILRHGVQKLADTLVIELEAEFVQIYKGQPLFGEIQEFLHRHGFQFHKFIDIAGRCFRPFEIGDNPFSAMSQALWADAVFVRDFTNLSNLTDMQLLKFATILHDVYLSYDFVLFILNELDRRNETPLSERYKDAKRRQPPRQRLFMNLKEHNK